VLRELVPKAALMGFLVNPTSVNAKTQLAAVMAANQQRAEGFPMDII
jgi:hypothetical protein